MKIESTKVEVNSNLLEVFNFLKDSTNLIQLLPQDKISDWNANTDECSFKVQGGVTISLIQNGDDNGNKIFMKSGEKSPFPFNLTLHLSEENNLTHGYIEFDGEVNMFLKMMVEKPLTSLFNHMAEKLKEKFQ
jgi:hypothetical protein